jgi:arylformamidase
MGRRKHTYKNIIGFHGGYMTEFYDVSLRIFEDMIVYPDNPGPSIVQYSHIPARAVNESSISLGSHTGTHVDAPLHIRNNAPGVDALPLDTFYGKCKVIDLAQVELEIHKKDLEKHPVEKGDIVLLRTRNSLGGYRSFRKDYVHVKMDAAEYLVSRGVKTLGFDYLSVKKFGGDDDVHEMLISHLTLFEGLDLRDVRAGEYTFIGLPLRVAIDGAPARVILVKE